MVSCHSANKTQCQKYIVENNFGLILNIFKVIIVFSPEYIFLKVVEKVFGII